MKKLLDKLSDFMAIVAGILFFFIFLINTMEIISRSFFNYSFLWVSDLSIICVVWTICLGISVGVYHREHIFMELLVNKFPENARKVVKIAIQLLSLAFYVMLFITGVQTAAAKTALIFPSIGWSLVWSYAALPVFALTSAIFLVPHIIALFKGEKEPEQEMAGSDVRFL